MKTREQASAKLIRDITKTCSMGFANEQDMRNFRKFMKLRFPDEFSASYILEWVDRWVGGYAISRADRKTEACLKQAGYKGDR